MKLLPLITASLFFSYSSVFGQIQLGQTIHGPAGRYFPAVIDISDDGTRMIAGDEENDAILVFDWQDSIWNQTAKIQINYPFIGTPTSLSGDGQVIVKEYEDYLVTFLWDGSQWNRKTEDLSLKHHEHKTLSDLDLSFDGSILALHHAMGTFSEFAFYSRAGNSWSPMSNPIKIGEKTYSSEDNRLQLASDGKTIILGCPKCERDDSMSGTVYVYQFDGLEWQRKGQILRPFAEEHFGRDIDISSDGSTILINALRKVVVYTWDGAQWQQKGNAFTNPGWDFALDGAGNRVAYSNPGYQDSLANQFRPKGAIHMLEFINGQWSYVGRPMIGKMSGDYFGKRIAFSRNGNVIAAGAGVYDGPGYLEAYSYDGWRYLPVVYVSKNTGLCDFDRQAQQMKFDVNGAGQQSFQVNINSDDHLFVSYYDSVRFRLIPESSYFVSTPPQSVQYGDSIENKLVQGFLRDTFCLIPKDQTTSDLKMEIVAFNTVRVGEVLRIKVLYTNVGTTVKSGSINLDFEGDYQDYYSAVPLYSDLSSNRISWDYSQLKPLEQREIIIGFLLNKPTSSTPLQGGETLTYTGRIDPVQGDVDVSNNEASANLAVVNSYDPNDKRCMQGEAIQPEFVGKRLTYVIRFENLGDAEAIDVLVSDVIDTAFFDIETFELLDASHSPKVRISNGNIIEFIFKNINLPFEDGENDGYVAFSIQLKEGLVVGQKIKNQASIFFDYNYPVITNEAITTIQDETTIVSKFNNGVAIEAFPNPASGLVMIRTEEEITSMTLYSLEGKVMLQEVYLGGVERKNTTLDLGSLPRGMYHLQVTCREGKGLIKLVKE